MIIPLPQEQRWYCVQTENRQEITAAVAISGLGFTVYCPMQIVDISHAGKRTQEKRPLFKRYLFVSSIHFGSPAPINHAKGVRHKGLFMKPGTETPYSIPNEVIQGIKKREFDMAVKAGEATSGLQPGDSFMVPVGPFAGIEATYTGEHGGRIYGFINFLGKEHPIDVEFDRLQLKREAA